jgi:hypothetical protein
MVAPSALLAVAVLLGLYLFVCLKKEIRRLEQRWDTDHQGLTRQIEAAHFAVGELRVGLKEAEERTGVLVPNAPLLRHEPEQANASIEDVTAGREAGANCGCSRPPEKGSGTTGQVHRIVLCAD